MVNRKYDGSGWLIVRFDCYQPLADTLYISKILVQIFQGRVKTLKYKVIHFYFCFAPQISRTKLTFNVNTQLADPVWMLMRQWQLGELKKHCESTLFVVCNRLIYSNLIITLSSVHLQPEAVVHHHKKN